MLFKDFTQLSLDYWDQYLQRISALQRLGAISQVNEGVISKNTLVILYPTILICTETDEYFIAELVGSRPDFNHLRLAKNRVPSINRYFYQFDIEATDPALLIDNKDYFRVQDLCFCHPVDLDALNQRFPFLVLSDSPRIEYGSGTGGVLDIRNGSNFISFQNCFVINRYMSAIRVKHIQHADVIHHTTTFDQYSNHLGQYKNTSEIYGILYTNSKNEEPYQVASQFANIFLFPGLRKTTIGMFLNSHPEFIRAAFCTPRYEYEPYLEWQEGNPDSEEKAINPDLLIQRPDGHFDIYDLKLAGLDKNKLTKGPRRRRRFVDYIAEGVAQLANYANYFDFSKNRNYALEKYNISVSGPHLVLVVGNFENVNKSEIDEACRILKNFKMIDYDTILHLYLNQTISNDNTRKRVVLP